MKKIISITAIVLVIACLCGVLAACGGGSSEKSISFKKAKIQVDYTPKATIASTNITEVADLMGSTYNTGRGVLVLTSKEVEGTTYYTLYNLATANVIVSSTTDKFRLYSNGTNSFYTRSSKDALTEKYTTVLYDAKGTEIKYLNSKGEETSSIVTDEIPEVEDVTYDIYTFANTYYRVVRDGEGVERIGMVSELSTFDYNFQEIENDTYYYQINNGQGKALIFDKKLNLVSTYLAHGDYDNISIYVMESGDLFVQTVTQLMDEDKEYTYISNGNKYEMKTYIVNAKNGKVTEKKFGYRVQFLAGASTLKEMIGTINAENVAVVYEIKNSRLMDSNNDVMIVSLTNALSVKGRLDQMIEGQTPGEFVSPVNQYFTVDTVVGTKLIDADGNVIGDYAGGSRNDSLLVTNGKIYNFELKMLFDYDEAGYDFVRMMNNSVILRKYIPGDDDYTAYYRFDATMSAPQQITTSTQTFQNLYFNYLYAVSAIQEGKTVYTYYNDKGEVVSSLPTTAKINNMMWNPDNEFGLFTASVYNADSATYVTHYYRIAK